MLIIETLYLYLRMNFKKHAMKQFKNALDFIQENESNQTALIAFIEQLLCEASDEVIEKALKNTNEYLTILKK